MAQKISELLLRLSFLLSTPSFGNTVRTALVNNDNMAPIYLKMGKSTVLRFTEKPKKVVVGNQNYYGLEFIENDVAIQPLGSVATNLFVYSEHHTYGFLLTPGDRYDDLVFVHWKYPAVKATSGRSDGSPSPAKETHLNLSFRLGDKLKIYINQIKGPATFGLFIVDCLIENLGKETMDLSALVLQASQKGRTLERQRVALESDHLKPGEKTKVRLILKIPVRESFEIEARLGKANAKVSIGKNVI